MINCFELIQKQAVSSLEFIWFTQFIASNYFSAQSIQQVAECGSDRRCGRGSEYAKNMLYEILKESAQNYTF